MSRLNLLQFPLEHQGGVIYRRFPCILDRAGFAQQIFGIEREDAYTLRALLTAGCNMRKTPAAVNIRMVPAMRTGW